MSLKYCLSFNDETSETLLETFSKQKWKTYLVCNQIIAMANPVTLVQGASRGLGLSFVRILANRSTNVIATCRNPSQAEELQRCLLTLYRENINSMFKELSFEVVLWWQFSFIYFNVSSFIQILCCSQIFKCQTLFSL